MSDRGYRRDFRLSGRNAGDVERDLDEEIDAHLAMRIEDLERSGMDPAQARAEALRRFGDMETARRRMKASAKSKEGRLRFFDLAGALRGDLRIGFRQAVRSPGYSVLAILTFALGIGLTTMTYTIVDRVLLRSLPFPQPERLVALQSVDSLGNQFPYISMGNWYDWQEGTRTLESTALISIGQRSATVRFGDEAVRVGMARVAGPFFDVMRPRLVRGRGFTVDEAQSRTQIAVVSENFWRSRLSAATELPSITIDGSPVQVVGVVADGSEYPAGTELWTHSSFAPEAGTNRNNINWYSVARLAPGATIGSAKAELSSIARRIRESDPAALYSWAVGVRPLREQVVSDVAEPLLLLFGSVALVLLIACANVAGLGLARATSRSNEVALRMAIGAGRGRVLRQLLTEGLIPAVAGGVLGVALAWSGTRLLVSRLGTAIPRADEIGLDLRVLWIAIGLTVLAGLLAAIVPAMRTSGVSLRSLVGGERGGVRGGRNLPGALLVGGEVALALVLLTGGLLLVRSFRSVLSRDLGFETSGVLVSDLILAAPRYYGFENPQAEAYWDALIERVRSIPGVRAASMANSAPGGMGFAGFIALEDRPGDSGQGSQYRVIGDDYFDALGIPITAGRAIQPTDVKGGERVVVVNRAFVDEFWPDVNPIGRRVRAVSQEGWLPGGAQWLTVIGVAADIRHWGREQDPDPEMYVSKRQVPAYNNVALTLIVRADPSNLAAVTSSLREEIRALDPAVAATVDRLGNRMDRILGSRRLTMTVLSLFSGLALLLAAIGLYGLISFAVARRTREIGVRAALGARRSGIIGMMMGSALRVVVAGAAAGVVAAIWLTRLMRGLLFGVQPGDPLAFALAAAVLLTVAAVASLIPALRAARLDPLDALRDS